MITHRMIRAGDLKQGMAVIIIRLPGRTIRSRVEMLQPIPPDLIKVAFSTGDIITFSTRSMLGWIAPRAAARRSSPRPQPRSASR